jgi:hypothetical protein
MLGRVAPILSVILALSALAGCGLTAWPEPRTPRAPEDPASPPLVFEPTQLPGVVINEIMAKNDSTIQDGPGEFPDWVELMNLSDAPVDGARVELVVPGVASWSAAGRVLPPGSLTVVFFDEGSTDPSQAPFPLDADGGTLAVRVDGEVTDEVAWPSLASDVAWARFPDGGDFAQTVFGTPGWTNGSGPGPFTDPTDALFRADLVHDLWLDLPPESEAALRADPEGARVVGTLAYGAAYWPQIEVRLKGGWGSFRSYDQKAGFKLELDAYDPGAAVRGLEVLTLNNMVQDPTYIHELLAYTVFRACGVPAPRIGYARLHVNGAFYGLYAWIETVDDEFLERWFDDPTGPLFEGAYGVDLYVGSEFSFEYDEGPDPNDRAVLTELATLLDRAPSEPGIWDEVQTLVDMDTFLSAMAVEALIYHWDGYTTSNNYRLYHDPSTDLFTMIPWGTDQTFVDAWYGPYDARGRLFVWCMGNADCALAYQDRLRSAADVFDAIAPTLERTMDDTMLLLAPDVAADPRRETDDSTMYAERDVTRTTLWTSGQRIRDAAGG